MFSNQQLKKLIIPLIIEQILVMSVGMIDTVMVSYISEAAISGVALVDMIDYLAITILSAVATGGAVIVSQYLGRKNTKQANLSAGQLFMISAVISCVIMVICLCFHKQILNGLYGSIDPEVMKAAVVYFVVTAISFPCIGVYNAGAALYRSMRKTNCTMWISLSINLINIAGNALGIFVLKIGVLGVALSTLLARLVSAAVITALAFRKHQLVSVCCKDMFTWNKESVQRILRIAVPSGIENGLFAFGKVLVVSIIALFGTSQIAANGVANSIDQIAVFAASAMNLAMITVIGQCVGAREYEQVRLYTRKLLRISYAATALLSIAVCLCLPLILKLYQLSDDTYVLACQLIIIHNIMAFLLHPTSFNLANMLRAAGDVTFTMYIGAASMLVFRLGTAALFGIVFQLGIYGVWLAMIADWTARSIAFVLRFRSGRWMSLQTI